MTKSIEVRCLTPQRRDALEESARLVLAFISVCSRPDRHSDWQKNLRLTLSALALHDGCYLPESAQSLLEAVAAFGVQVCRQKKAGDDSEPPEEWSQWWGELPFVDEHEFDLILEII